MPPARGNHPRRLGRDRRRDISADSSPLKNVNLLAPRGVRSAVVYVELEPSGGEFQTPALYPS